MVYFKTFDNNMNVKKGSVIGNVDVDNKGIKIYKNPIFVVQPNKKENIHIIIPKTKVTHSNGDSVYCKLIELGDEISIEDMITLDIDIDYKINLIKRVFDRDVQKKYDLFNHIHDVDTTGEMLFKFSKNFPDAISRSLMYSLISNLDKTGEYLSQFTVLNDGYKSSNSIHLAILSNNYKAIVHMAVNGIHAGLVGLQSLLVMKCDDVFALKEFLEYAKTIKGLDTYSLEHKVMYLSRLYDDIAVV